MDVTHYNLLSARNTTDTNMFVTAAIADGWQPLDGVAVTPDGLLVQAVVKTAEEPPAG